MLPDILASQDRERQRVTQLRLERERRMQRFVKGCKGATRWIYSPERIAGAVQAPTAQAHAVAMPPQATHLKAHDQAGDRSALRDGDGDSNSERNS